MSTEIETTEEYMTTRFHLRSFDEQTLKDFYTFSQTPGKKIIYLSSTGGLYAICVGIMEIINDTPEEYEIHLAEFALSCGAQFLRYTNCPITEVGIQYNLPMLFLWHSTQRIWTYSKEELINTLLFDKKDFEALEHVLTKKQIRKRKRYAWFVSKCKYLGCVLNDDITLSIEQVKELLGDRFEVRGE